MKFIPNTGFEAEFMRQASTVNLMGQTADAVIEKAKQIAEPFRDTGRYIEGLEAQAGMEDGEAVGRASASAVESGFVELGTRNNPAYAPLRRACDAAGLRMTRGR